MLQVASLQDKIKSLTADLEAQIAKNKVLSAAAPGLARPVRNQQAGGHDSRPGAALTRTPAAGALRAPGTGGRLVTRHRHEPFWTAVSARHNYAAM